MSEQLHYAQETIQPSIGQLLVITGPSGAGKDTLVNRMLQNPELGYRRIVTYTSRQKRPNETEGVDYHFISPEEFQQKIEEDFFAEWVDYGGFKGTPRAPFLELLEGAKYIWRIDPSRAAILEEFYNERMTSFAEELLAHTIPLYIGTSRLTLLKDRFKSRECDTYSQEDFKTRINKDWSIWNEYQQNFPYVIYNDGTEDEMYNQTLELLQSI